jgi:hypothetical protein
MAGGGCSIIPSIFKRNGGVAPANHFGRGRVGVERHLASKRRRRPEASRRGGTLPAGGGGLVQGGKCWGGLCWAGWATRLKWCWARMAKISWVSSVRRK